MFLISKLKCVLKRTNNLMLVLGIIAAASINRAFTAFLDDVFTPLLSHTFGLRDWSAGQFVLSQTVDASGSVSVHAIKFGHFAGIVFDLCITALVVLIAARLLHKVSNSTPAQAPLQCPKCGETYSVEQGPHKPAEKPIDFRPEPENQVIPGQAIVESHDRLTNPR